MVEHSASVEVFNIAVLAHEESLSSILVTLSLSFSPNIICSWCLVGDSFALSDVEM